MADQHGDTVYRYDRGLLESVATPDGDTLHYTWDAAGRRASLRVSGGQETVYGHDAAGRLATVEHPELGEVGYGYDADGLLVSESLPDGGERAWDRDAHGRVVGHTQTLDGHTTATALDRDRNGRVVAETIAEPLAETRLGYRYDPAGQLVEVAREVDGPCPPGAARGRGPSQRPPGCDNRPDNLPLPAQQGCAQAAQLPLPCADADRVVSYAYDATGNRVSVTVADDALGTHAVQYGYDPAGQLVSALGPEGETAYAHDDAGRRVGEDGPRGTVETVYDAAGLPSSTVERTARRPDEAARSETRRHDGDGRLVEVAVERHNRSEAMRLAWDTTRPVPQVAALTDAGTGQRTEIVHGHGVIGHSGVGGHGPAVFSLDAHGSVLARSDGDPLAAASGYDPHGAPDPDTHWDPPGLRPDGGAGKGPPGGQPPGQADTTPVAFGYRGELHTGGTVHLRARDYHPGTGVFTTTDPLDGVDGEVTVSNPYHYAANDPLNRTDPLGLTPFTDTAIRTGSVDGPVSPWEPVFGPLMMTPEMLQGSRVQPAYDPAYSPNQFLPTRPQPTYDISQFAPAAMAVHDQGGGWLSTAIDHAKDYGSKARDWVVENRQEIVRGGTLAVGVGVCVAASFGWCALAAGAGFAGRSASTIFWGDGTRDEKARAILEDGLATYVTLGAGSLFAAAGPGLQFATRGGKLIHADRLLNAAVMDIPATAAILRQDSAVPAPALAPRQPDPPFHPDPTKVFAV